MTIARVMAVILLLLAVGCAAPYQPETSSPQSDANPPAAEATAPATEPLTEGMAGIYGTLYNTAGDGPLPGTAFYLTPALSPEHDEPPAVFAGAQPGTADVPSQSGAQGEILLANISPGAYYLVVWAPYNWLLSTESEEDETPRLIVLEANQWHDLDRVFVSWP